MKKKSLLLISPVLVAGVISSCGSGWNKVSTEDAIKVANAYDTRLSDVVMKDSDARIHINSLGVKNGTGMLSYQKYDKAIDKGGKVVGGIVGVDLNNVSFTAGEQDLANLLLPNSLLNDANHLVSATESKNKLDSDTTFATLSYVLSATVSENMIRMYTGSLEKLYGVKEWKHMKTNIYSKKSSNGNDILQADITIDSFTGLKDEMVAAKIPGVADTFNILGEGTMKISATCDDFGYISHLGIKAGGKDLTFSKGKHAASGGGSLPGIADLKELKVMPTGIDIKGELDVDVSIDITHNQAEEYPVSFQRTSYKVSDEKQEKVETVSIDDITKDGILSFEPYAPIKVDPTREDTESKGYIYGPTASAFEGNGYAVKIKIKTGEAGKEGEWVLGNDYMYLGATGENLEEKCKSLLDYYNYDRIGIESKSKEPTQPYPYATLIVNGIRVNTKTKDDPAASPLGTDYCYFTFETAKEDNEAKSTDLYLVLHVGKDIISKAKKTLGATPKLIVDLKLQKLK